MEGKAAMVPGGRRCSRMARKDPPAAMRECSGFEGRNSHTLLRLLPEDLVFEILVRLPAKSVARFRCISTAWLSITTDPFFILAHARRAPKSLLVRSIPIIRRNGNHFPNLLFSFSLCGFFCCKRRLDHLSDEAISSLDGLVLFCRNKDYHPCESNYYVINPLIGLRIDLPHLNRRSLKNVRTMDLYYHRWTGEYRLLNLNKCIEGPDNFHLDAEVLSLGKASSSWRQIKDKAPLDVVFNNHRRIQVNDCFYWTGQESIDTPTILVFDILKETFSLMELPSYSQKSTFPSFAVGSCLKYGLVDIEGILCLYCVYRDKSCVNNVMIDIWAATDDCEKWKNTHSLCLVNEWRWAHSYSFQSHRLADFCFCFREKELMFLFDGGKGGPLMDQIEEYTHYLFHWNLKSGKYRTMRLLSGFEVLRPSALICKETLITAPFSHTIVTN